MSRTTSTVALSLLLLAAAPLRSAEGETVGTAPAAEVERMDALRTLLAGLDRPVTLGYTVRVAGFVDPDGTVGAAVADELRGLGLEIEIKRVERGAMVTRLRVGRLARSDAERLARALEQRYDWPVYVTRAPAPRS
jgi:hypothetical protein